MSRDAFAAFVEALGPTEGGSDPGCPLLGEDEFKQITEMPADAPVEHQVLPDRVWCDIAFSSSEDLSVSFRLVPEGSSLDEEIVPWADPVEADLYVSQDSDTSDSVDESGYYVVSGNDSYLFYGAVRNRPAEVEIETARKLASAVGAQIAGGNFDAALRAAGEPSTSTVPRAPSDSSTPSSGQEIPAGTPSGHPGPGAIRDVDFHNATWPLDPDSLCGDGLATELTLVDGRWEGAENAGASIIDSEYIDLTGDGHEDVAFVLNCSLGGVSGYGSNEVVFWRWDAEGRQPVAYPPLGWGPMGSLDEIGVAVGGQLVVVGRLSPGVMLGAGREMRDPVSVTLTWTGAGLDIASVTGGVERASDPRSAVEGLIEAARKGDVYEMYRYATREAASSLPSTFAASATVRDCTDLGDGTVGCSLAEEPIHLTVEPLPGIDVPDQDQALVGHGWIVTDAIFAGGM